jgi:hypothetical protein
MGYPHSPQQSTFNPKPISKREFDDNEDASAVTYSEWLVGLHFFWHVISMIFDDLLCVCIYIYIIVSHILFILY